MPENGGAVLSDPWVQIFGAAALLSGALALRAPSRLPPPAVQASSQAPAPAAARTAAAQPEKVLRAKKPGQWLVDKTMSPEADTSDLAKALASAAEGDRIMLAPGTYEGPFVVSKSVQLVGAGAKSDVRLTSNAGITLQLASGKTFLKNLSVAGAATPGAAALSIERAAEASLQDVSLSASGTAVRVSGGVLAASRADFSGKVGVSLDNGGKARLEQGSAAGSDAGVLLKGDGLSVELAGVRFRDCGRALDVEGRSRAAVEDADFSLSAAGGAVFAFAGADVSVRRGRFELNHAAQVALFAQEATLAASGVKIRGSKGAAVIARKSSTVNLEDCEISDSEWAALVVEEGSRARAVRCRITDNLDCALHVGEATVLLDGVTAARNRCGAAFYGAGKLDAKGSTFSDHKLGAVVVKPGLEGSVSVSGIGDQGLPAAQAVTATPALKSRSAAYFSGGHLKGDPFAEAQAWMKKIGH